MAHVGKLCLVGPYEVLMHRDNLLGCGSFGHVYKCKHRNGDRAAAKKLDLHQLDAFEAEKMKTSEILPYLKRLDHHNVIKFLYVQDSELEMWIVMELADSNLETYVTANNINSGQCELIFIQCADALLYLHSFDVIHRDIKPNNILLKMVKTQPVVKITDFSFAKDVKGHSNSYMNSVRGNLHWIAPELLTDNGLQCQNAAYKKPIDLFSLGLVFVFCAITEFGVFRNRQLGVEVRRGNHILNHFRQCWRDVALSEKLEGLLTALLAFNPHERPNAQQLADRLREVFRDSAARMAELVEYMHRVPGHGNCDSSLPGTALDTVGSTSLSPPLSLPSKSGNIPLISTTAPTLSKLHTHVLGFEGHFREGSMSDGCILLGRWDTRQLCLYNFNQGEYKHVWAQPCPPGVSSTDGKYLVGAGDGLRLLLRAANGDDPTHVYTPQMQLETRHNVADRHRLVGILPGGRLVYREKLVADDWQLAIYAGETRLGVIAPPPSEQRWNQLLSICCHDETGYVAVTDQATKSLDIFNHKGTRLHHSETHFQPWLYNAVACSLKHIFVGDEDAAKLHVYNWSGQLLADVALTQLGYAADERVKCVGVDGCVLHVATALSTHKVTAITAIQLTEA